MFCFFFTGTYLGSNPNFNQRTPNNNNNKKRPISPEQVLRLFGSNSHQSNSKLNAERSRRSPASSPPSTTHQINYNNRPPYGLSLHELSTRTITMVRDPADPGFGICVKGGKDAGKSKTTFKIIKLSCKSGWINGS